MLTTAERLHIIEQRISSIRFAFKICEPTNPAEKAFLYNRANVLDEKAERLREQIDGETNRRLDQLGNEIQADMRAIDVYNARYDNNLFRAAHNAIHAAYGNVIDSLDSEQFNTVTTMLDAAMFFCGCQKYESAPAVLLKRMAQRPDMIPAVMAFLTRFGY